MAENNGSSIKSSSSDASAAAYERGRASRLASLLALLTPQQVRESLLLSSIPSPRNAAIAGAQAALSVLLALTLTYLSPWPQHVGFTALGALAALFGRYASLSRRRYIVAMCTLLLTTGVFLMSAAVAAWPAPVFMMLVVALIAGGAVVAVSHWRLGGPGAVIILFAAGAAMSPVGGWAEVLERTIATAAGGCIGWLLCLATDRLRSQTTTASASPPVRSPPISHQLIAGVRSAAAVLVSALIALTAGWQHPEWAAIGTLAVMQGRHLHVTMNRALQRMAGTIVGSMVAWFILAQHPSFWVVVALIVVFQFVTEVIIGYNYALGQITITPMALLMTSLTAPIIDPNLPVERVLDTILGAALGIVFAVIFSTLDDRVHLARRLKRIPSTSGNK